MFQHTQRSAKITYRHNRKPVNRTTSVVGITIKPEIGIGDGLQYSSLPENYFRATGRKLQDLSRPWFFDHNPYVERGAEHDPTKTLELWNFSPRQYDWPDMRTPHEKPRVFLSNAEIWAGVFNVPVVLNRPRLYMFEEYPYHKREKILFQTEGRSHGVMPEQVVQHVLQKYGPSNALFHIGPGETYGLPHIETNSLWGLAEEISKAKMLIGLDSGPAWIGACYPDVIVKKLRTKPGLDSLKTWVPLEIDNFHSHWDDRCHQIFNTTSDDIGFTSSYRRI